MLKKFNYPLPFKLKQTRPRKKTIIAYDLETTNITPNETPRPLYITAYGFYKDGEEFLRAQKLNSSDDLLEILATDFLIPQHDGFRFVGWNANNFDVYLIARALLLDSRYELRPYMTRSKSLRGLRVVDMTNMMQWEFLDGMAMTGCMMTLEKFLHVFAPDYEKLKDVINFEAGEVFDAGNSEHCAYALRDSVGLYHALIKAQGILKDVFGQILNPTIGNTGIKVFQSFLPVGVSVQELTDDVDTIVREQVTRGGYCYCARRYTGKVWKYDINQAYAAAMREAWLPEGRATKVHGYWQRYPGIYQINATHETNIIPFYYKDNEGHAVFGMREITDTWITSSELEQLMQEGWDIKLKSGYLFSGRFKMKEYVDTLEHTRMNAEGGTNGAKGLMIKAIGNNSYGKTLEQLDGVEYVLAEECPEGFLPVIPDAESELYDLPIWVKKNEPQVKDYHKPHIGAFITAHVRMVVRRAALTCAEGWLYADTDCVVFDRPPVGLDIDAKRYGAWKVECEGEEYRIITKKVYAKVDNTEKHAKGMNVKRLSADDFEKWSRGEEPTQTQVHRNNILKVLGGADMYIERVRRGTKVSKN